MEGQAYSPYTSRSKAGRSDTLTGTVKSKTKKNKKDREILDAEFEKAMEKRRQINEEGTKEKKRGEKKEKEWGKNLDETVSDYPILDYGL